MTAGSSEKNEGTITVRVDGAGATRLVIQPGNNQTLMAFYTVPANFKGTVHNVTASCAKLDDATVRLYVREFGGVFQLKDAWTIFQNATTKQLNQSIGPRADVELRCVSAAASVSDTFSGTGTSLRRPGRRRIGRVSSVMW